MAEAGVPSEDGEEMEGSRSNAVRTEDCIRVAVEPSNGRGGAPEAAPIEWLAEAGVKEVAEAGVPSEDGEVMEESRSNAIGTEDCIRVAVEPSNGRGGAPEATPIEGLAEAVVNEVAEAGVPSEDGEVMEESRSNAIGTEDCIRVAVEPSNEYEGGGAPEAAPIEGLPETDQSRAAGVIKAVSWVVALLEETDGGIRGSRP